MGGQYGGLPAAEYIEKLEDAISKMKVQFTAMRTASHHRDERMDELIKRTRSQSDQISALQAELSMQVTSNATNSENKMTGLVREKMQIIDQQQKDLQGLKGEIELLKQAAVIADKRSKELAKWREKAALLAKLESVVRESAQSEKVKAEQLSQMKDLRSLSGNQQTEEDALMNIKIAQIDALEKQIAEMKKQFQQSQLHSAELLKAKDQAWAIKLKQAEEAAKREADSQSQCALIDELQDELRERDKEILSLKEELFSLQSVKSDLIAQQRDEATTEFKLKLTKQLEDSKSALRRTRGEIEVLSTMTSRDKEIIASQQRALAESKEQERVIDMLQNTCHRLQEENHEKDMKSADLMDKVRQKDDEIRGLRTTMQFSKVVQAARSNKEHEEADKQMMKLKEQIDAKEEEMAELDRLLEKKGRLIETQRDFSNEVFGRPLRTEEIQETLNAVNDGLIQVIRDSSGVSWTMARNTIQCILEILFDRLPGGKIVNAINQVMRPGPFWGDNDGGRDRTALEEYVLVLAAFEDHSRTGIMLSNDEGSGVVEAIDAITTIVKEASGTVVTSFLRDFEHSDIHPEVVDGVNNGDFTVLLMLTALYQETGRVDIRRALCRCFHAMGHLLPEVHHLLQSTCLPLEIARDVKERGILGQDSDEDIAELEEALELAVVLLGHGDVLPAVDVEYMDAVFVRDLLQLAESDADNGRAEHIKTLALEVVLAFNLQFAEKDAFVSQTRRSRQALAPHTSNTVLKALSQFALDCKHKNISDRLLKLANRLSDPLNIPEFAEQCENRTEKQNSVLKLLVDLFTDDTLAQCFFGISDLQVLVDISLREIEDKEPDDVQRLQFVQLLAAIAIRSSYEQLEPELKNTQIRPTLETLSKDSNSSQSKVVEMTARVARESLRLM